MSCVLRRVDCRVDEIARLIAVAAADQQLEAGIRIRLVDGGRELLKRRRMDHRADEVGEIFRISDFQRLCLRDELAAELGPDARGDICARASAAFLALEFKGGAHGVSYRVGDIGTGVDEMEVFPACLADDTRVSDVLAVCNTLGNFTVQRAEDGRAACVMQGGEVRVVEDCLCNLLGVAGDELDDAMGQAGFDEDAVG